MGQSVRSPRGPRCIALVGPFQSGKTTLLEAILSRTGAIPKSGTVEAGTTVGDASAEARSHRMSVALTAASTTLSSRWLISSRLESSWSRSIEPITVRMLVRVRLSTAFCRLATS